MGSSSTSELSINNDTNLTSPMKTINGFLKEVSEIKDGMQRSTKVEEFMKRLEEERGKIQVFKRELPLCMHILDDAIEVLKQEIVKCEEDEKDCREKQSWMSSVQLWSDNSDHNNNINESESNDVKEKSKDSDRTENEIKYLGCNYFNGRGAFMPFKGISGLSMIARKTEKVVLPLPDLSLMPHGINNSVTVGSSSNVLNSKRTLLPSPMPSVRPNSQSIVRPNSQSFQSPRKERRCWSPELHRRFVHALQQLGGTQVATPKQIRDLMKVDGLTNDEVKSHLQKYRLHTRRDPANQQVMMLGEVWAPHDLPTISKQSNSQSSSPQGPLQLAGTTQGISLTGGESCEDEDR